MQFHSLEIMLKVCDLNITFFLIKSFFSPSLFNVC